MASQQAAQSARKGLGVSVESPRGRPQREAVELKPSPLPATTWTAVVDVLELPPRQAEVVSLVIRGASDKQIAIALGLAEPTVREYLGRLFRRLKVEDRTALAVSVMATAISVKASSAQS